MVSEGGLVKFVGVLYIERIGLNAGNWTDIVACRAARQPLS